MPKRLRAEVNVMSLLFLASLRISTYAPILRRKTATLK